MQCPSCGQVNTPNAKFCANCGAVLPPPAPAPAPGYGFQTPPKKPFPWVWVAAGAGGLLVLVLVLAFALGGNDDTPTPPPAPAQQTTQNTQPQQSKPAPAPAQKQSALANSYFVGKWRCWSFGGGSCPVGWEDLQVRADGTYTLAQKDNGTWAMNGDNAVFKGPLAFAGPAEKYKDDQFQFDYTDSKSGFSTYILFVRY